MKRSNKLPAALLGLLAGLLLAGCATVQPTAIPVGERRRPPKPSAATVQWFRETEPTRPFEVVARLNVHLEKTFLIPSAFEEARPRLEDLARQQGADAIIRVQEKKSRYLETFIFNVSATAIVFTD